MRSSPLSAAEVVLPAAGVVVEASEVEGDDEEEEEDESLVVAPSPSPDSAAATDKGPRRALRCASSTDARCGAAAAEAQQQEVEGDGLRFLPMAVADDCATPHRCCCRLAAAAAALDGIAVAPAEREMLRVTPAALMTEIV